MELFTAGDEAQMNVIKRWIEESDVFMLILGGRYGSIEPKSQKSYIQLEYEYAVELKKPCFAVVIDDEYLEKKIKKHGTKVYEAENQNKLREFRALVLARMVRFWKDTKDIELAIHQKLTEYNNDPDLVGWVRSNEVIPDSEFSIEHISRSKITFLKDFPPAYQSDMEKATELWLVGITLREAIHKNLPRIKKILNKEVGCVKVLLVHPDGPALKMAAFREYAYADSRPEYKSIDIKSSLSTFGNLKTEHPGKLEVRTIEHPLSHGIIAIDPETTTGILYIASYTFKVKDGAKPKFVLSSEAGYWYKHYVDELKTTWEYSNPWESGD